MVYVLHRGKSANVEFSDRLFVSYFIKSVFEETQRDTEQKIKDFSISVCLCAFSREKLYCQNLI